MSDGKVSAFLQALNDDTSRELLGALCGEAKPVRELSEECEIPLSTAYRKVNQLQAAGLVEEENLVNDDSKPLSTYVQSFEAALVTPTADGSVKIEFVDDPQEESAPAKQERNDATTNTVAPRSSGD